MKLFVFLLFCSTHILHIFQKPEYSHANANAMNIIYSDNSIIFFNLVAPHIMPFEIDESVFSGESVQLTCHVTKGDSPLEISWSFQGWEMSSHLGITTTKVGEKTSLLSISSIMGSHSGNYTCTAKNPAGANSYTTTLRVIGTITLLNC